MVPRGLSVVLLSIGSIAILGIAGLQQVGATCPSTQKCVSGTDGLILAYLQINEVCIVPNDKIQVIEASMQSYLSNYPELFEQINPPSGKLPLNSEYTLQWAQQQIADKRFIYLATHGLSGGSVMLEMTATVSQANERANEYTLMGYQAYNWTNWVMLTPSGIGNHLSPAECGLVYADYCASWQGNSSWNCAAFVGSDHSACTCIDAHTAGGEFFFNIHCNTTNVGNLRIGSAIDPAHRANPSLLLRSRGDDMALSCLGCAGLASRFDRVGAFEDVVWGIIGDGGRSKLQIRGYRSISEWPAGGAVVARASETRPGIGFYVVDKIPREGNQWLAFESIDAAGASFFSDPFEWTVKPEDWLSLAELNSKNPSEKAMATETGTHQAWLGKNGEILAARPDEEVTANPNDGAEVGLYWVDPTLPAIERDNLINLSRPIGDPYGSPTWTSADINLYSGDGSVAHKNFKGILACSR